LSEVLLVAHLHSDRDDDISSASDDEDPFFVSEKDANQSEMVHQSIFDSMRSRVVLTSFVDQNVEEKDPFANETADERRVRLAKQYLSQLAALESDDEDVNFALSLTCCTCSDELSIRGIKMIVPMEVSRMAKAAIALRIFFSSRRYPFLIDIFVSFPHVLIVLFA